MAVDVAKLVEHTVVGQQGNTVSVPKLVMYVIGTPGADGGSASKQGHVHTQILRRG